MPSWKKVILSGSNAELASLNALSITGSLQGTSSWSRNSISASFATTSTTAATASTINVQNTIGTGTYFLTMVDSQNTPSAAAEIVNTQDLSYNGFTGVLSFYSGQGTVEATATSALTASYITASRVFGPWGANSVISASYAATSSLSLATTENRILVLNQSGYTISKGIVVHITASGNSSDIPRVVSASYESDAFSANTLGIASETIASGNQGYVTTEGVLTGINTSAFTSGQLVYLGAQGSIVGTAPQAPLHAVRLGQIIREQSINGSMYVRIDNGYEMNELHDVTDTTTTASYGDLLVKSGSVWTNSRQLTGSYGLTGSLTATSFTGSLQGTASYAVIKSSGSTSFPTIYSADPTAGSKFPLTGSIIIGQEAGYLSSGSQYLIALGYRAGYNTTVASYSTFLNHSAGSGADFAEYSNFIGYRAGYLATYANNSNFFGYLAGQQQYSASYSNIIGYASGRSGSWGALGTNNIIIGTNISLPNGYSNYANIGGVLFISGTYGTTSGNNLTTPITNGRIGIGIVTPSASLHIQNTSTNNSFLVDDSTNPDASPFIIDNAGNTSIGTTSSYGPLTVRGVGASGVTIDTDANAGNDMQSTRLFFKISGSGNDISMRNLSGSLLISTKGTANNSSGTPVVVISGSGTVGIGTSGAPSMLTVSAPAVTATQESIARFEVADDTSSYLRIYNGTTIDSVYVPTIEGRNSSIYAGLYAVGISTTDTGTTPISIFDSRLPAAAVVTRPLFQWNNYGTALMTMRANGNLGIGTTTPAGKLHVVGNGGSLLYDDNNAAGQLLELSGSSDELIRHQITTPTGSAGLQASLQFGIRGPIEASYPGYGKVTDSFIYASNYSNGLNIINYGDNTKEDYIRFYAGKDANGTTPDIHIQGSGSTQGYVGIGTSTPSAPLHVVGSTLITGTMTVASSSIGPNENTLTLGARDAVNEGGQIGFNAPGVTYPSASFIDLYQNRLRVLKGTNAGSTGEVATWNMHTLQMQLPAYTNSQSFSGTPAGYLAFDTSGNIITTAVSGSVGGTSNAFPYTGSALITGSLGITGSLQVTTNITASGLLINGASSNNLVRITQTGAGNAFVIEDSSNPDNTPFIIDSTGSVGIGTNSLSGFNTKLIVVADTNGWTGIRSTGFNNHGMVGNALSIGYAGVYGISSTDGSGTGIGVYGRAEAADTGFNGQIWLGGKFEAAGDPGIGSNYSVQLKDGTEAAGKVLVDQDSSGSANWSTRLSGSYEITGSLKLPTLSSATTANAIYYDTATGALTYGAVGSGNAFPYTGSAQITGSLAVTGSVGISGSLNFNIIGAPNAYSNIFTGAGPRPISGSLAPGTTSAVWTYGDGGNDYNGLIIQTAGTSIQDVGGLKITEDGVAIFGAGDTDLLRVVDEDVNTQRFVINGSGWIGINKTSTDYSSNTPLNATLDVNGDAIITGSLTVTSLPSVTTADAVYYNATTGVLSYGAAGGGGGSIATSGTTLYSTNPPTSGFSTAQGIFIGSGSGKNATNADASNFIGYLAGNTATNAESSNFIGFAAGIEATNAAYSNFIGQAAGGYATNASYSIFIGYQAGYEDVVPVLGSNNIIIGNNLMLPSGSRNSINIGGVLFGTGTNSDMVSNPLSGSSANGRISIGKTTPNATLDVNGSTIITGSLTITGSSELSSSIIVPLSSGSSGKTHMGVAVSKFTSFSYLADQTNIYTDKYIQISYDTSGTDPELTILTAPAAGRIQVQIQPTGTSTKTTVDLLTNTLTDIFTTGILSDQRLDCTISAGSDKDWPFYRMTWFRSNTTYGGDIHVLVERFFK